MGRKRNDEELLRELLEIFFVEAREELSSLNQGFLALEESPAAGEAKALLEQIFRSAHTLKGSAAAVNLPDIALLAHRLESLLGEMQGDELRRDRRTFDLLYRALDAIASLVESAEMAGPSDVDVTGLAAALDAATSAARDRQQGSGPPPAGDERAPSGATAATGSRDPESTPGRPANDARARQESHGEPSDEATGGPGSRPSDDTVRLSTSRLDALLALVGELVVATGAQERNVAELRTLAGTLAEQEASRRWRQPRHALRGTGGTGDGGAGRAIGPADPRQVAALISLLDEDQARLRTARTRLRELARMLTADSRRISQATAEVQEEVRRARMIPARTSFQGFPRMVRDLARDRAKEIRLEIRGEETEIDRAILEQIKGPLTHLLRNAVDHGIEEPGVRLTAGKRAFGRIVLLVEQRGAGVRIEVTDDGAGIDVGQLKATAVEKGLLSREEAAALTDRDALALIFRSGFTTARIVSQVSGRGVGLDVVRESVERMNGAIEVDTRPGEGTRFALSLPLTVATTRCLLARERDFIFAIPLLNVRRIVRSRRRELRRAGGRTMALVEGEGVAAVRLADLLEFKPSTPPEAEDLPALLLASGERRLAVLVTSLLGAQEIVVKSFPPPLRQVPGATGAAVLPTGEVAVVLTAADMIKRADSRPLGLARPDEASRAEPPVVLIVHDAITARVLQKNLLATAGYGVRLAPDGMQAWTVLDSERIDLVVAPVETPGMDGLQLTRRIRSDARLEHLPVVLITSLDTAENRRRGLEAGADAYVVRNTSDQTVLLEAIRRLI